MTNMRPSVNVQVDVRAHNFISMRDKGKVYRSFTFLMRFYYNFGTTSKYL